MLRARRLSVFSLAVALGALAVPAAAQVGNLTGRVIDANGNPLPGAAITVEGSELTAHSEADGSYRLVAVPAGAQVVEINYLSFEPERIEVEVAAGATSRRDLRLTSAVFAEELTVTGNPILQGQARALNQQRNALDIVNIVSADQIGRFPDPNAAEATHRAPGVSLQRDQGEGRYVSLRGTEPGMSSTMINGERLPSPEGDGRSVALDVIPADLLESIEISKAVTPDMDADAIGGVVNLVTKVAPEEGRTSIAFGGGYNDLMDDDTTLGNFVVGRRWNGSATGLVLSGSLFDTNRGSDNIEPEYDDGELDDLQLRDYTINRERLGLSGTLDHRPSDSAELRFNAVWNEFGDQEYRRRLRFRPGDDAIERELKDRYEVQEIGSMSFRGSFFSDAGRLFEYRVSYSTALESEPDRFDTTFVQEDVEFDPNVSPTSINPGNIQANPRNADISQSVLDDIVRENNLTEDEEVGARFDLSLPVGGLDRGGLLKFGAKGRFKDKNRDNEVYAFEGDDIFLTSYLDGFRNPSPFFGGKYGDIGEFSRASTPNELIDGLGIEGEREYEEDLADYDTSEDTVAVYGMVEYQFGAKTSLVGGMRVENSDTSFSAFELQLDEEGDFAGFNPLFGTDGYTEFLPSVQLRHELDDQSNLRAAVSRTLARPRFSDLAPYQFLIEEDLEIERGNPSLEVTRALNLDLLYERYFESVGIVSAGVFHKELEDNVFLYTFDELRGEDLFRVTQPLNGDSASVSGFEFAFQNRFRSLPGALEGLGIYFNMTLTDSEANYPERASAPLQGQSDEVANLAVSYEKGRFSGRLSYNLAGKFLAEVGDGPEEDVYVDDHEQMDFSARVQLAGGWSLALDVINLTDEPFRVYEGSADRPIQIEQYGWWSTLSVRFDF